MTNQTEIVSSQNYVSKLPSVCNLFKRSWQVYRARFWTFLGIVLIPALIAIPLVISLLAFKTSFRLGFLLFIIFLILFIIFSLWSQVALLFAIKDKEERIGIREAFKRAKSKIISYFWISILSGFIAFVGFLLLIIPGIIFSIWFSLANFVLVSEDKRGFSALLRSRQWISGYWWKVFWRFLVLGLFYLIIFLGILLPIDFFISKNFTGLMSYVISILITPFVVAFSFLLYNDLKKIKGEIPFEETKRKKYCLF